MESFDLALNKNNDLDISSDDFSFTTDDIYTFRQRLSIFLQTWVDEWFWNVSFGIPYRQTVMRKGTTKEEIDAIFIAAINSYDEVKSILNFSGVVDRNLRTYSLNFYVDTDFGKQRIYLSIGKKKSESLTSAVIEETCIYGTIGNESSSEFYRLLNVSLPTEIPWI